MTLIFGTNFTAHTFIRHENRNTDPDFRTGLFWRSRHGGGLIVFDFREREA